jgi:hypothetical protein
MDRENLHDPDLALAPPPFLPQPCGALIEAKEERRAAIARSLSLSHNFGG